jgi:hypothetical protein
MIVTKELTATCTVVMPTANTMRAIRKVGQLATRAGGRKRPATIVFFYPRLSTSQPTE